MRKEHTNTVIIGYSVKAGAHNEDGFPLGTAHFLEHMMFKGTKRLSNIEINRRVTGMGGHMNAFTNFEETRYYVVVPKPCWKEGFDLLNQVMWEATLPEQEMDVEKDVVLDEIMMYRSDSLSLIMDTLHGAWMRHHPNRQTVLGVPDSVASITRKDLLRFVDTYYRPENMNLVVMGDIDHAEVVAITEGIAMRENGVGHLAPLKPYQSPDISKDLLVEKGAIDQAITAFSFVAPSIHHQDAVAMDVLAVILGGNEGSRLYQVLREERGYAYQVMVQYDSHDDIGFVQGFVGSAPEHAEEIRRVILEELLDIETNGLTDEEFERTMAYLRGSFLLSIDSPHAVFDHVAEMLRYDEDIRPETYLTKLDALKKEDIQRVVREHARTEDVLFGFLKPKPRGWKRLFRQAG